MSGRVVVAFFWGVYSGRDFEDFWVWEVDGLGGVGLWFVMVFC